MRSVFDIAAAILALPIVAIYWVVSLFEDQDKTRRRQESRETKKLREKVIALRDASPLSSVAPVDLCRSIVEGVLDEACDQGLPNVEIVEGMFDTVEALMYAEGLGDIPTIESTQQMGLEEGVRLRNLFRRQLQFYADADHNFSLWCTTVQHLLHVYMAALPAAAFNEDMDADQEEPGRSLTATLIDLVEQPAELIESLTYPLIADDIADAGLFADVRSALLARYTEASRISPSEARILSPQQLLNTYFAGTQIAPLFAHTISFSLPDSARFEHCHIVAGTGHGKTQTLQGSIYDDIQRAARGECSVVVIDSQGDLINTISHLEEFSPQHPSGLSDRLMLIDPNDVEYPVCLNIFDMHQDRIAEYDPVDREKILNSAIELYEYIFGALLGAELTQKQGVIFRYLARLMLVIPNATIRTLVALIEDGTPYKPYMRQLTGTSRKFFETQFFDRSFSATKTQILRRLWGVLANPTFERMFSHVENKIDLFTAMNDGKVILINTAKDLLKREGSEILGRFFLAMIAQAALERGTIPAERRKPTFVYVDEAHEYFDETVEMLLGQARKYKIGFTIAHQTLDQANSGLRASMMANTSIKFAGGVSNKDARAFASEMRCEPDFIQGMRKHRNESEFACFVKHVTEQAIKVSVPLGWVDARPQMTDAEFCELVEGNRARYAAPASVIGEWEYEGTQLIEPPQAVAEPIVPLPVEATARPSETPNTLSSSQSSKLRTPQPEQRTPPQPMGHGGHEHRYLQNLVKGFAEAQGYRAAIENDVFDGAGRVDVSLSSGDERIACEISVSTSPEHEHENVRKCLDAGYDGVIVVTARPKHRHDIERHLKEALAAEESNKVSVVLPDQIVAVLENQHQRKGDEATVVRGIKVKVSHTELPPDEAARRRAEVAKVIAGTLRGISDDHN